MSLNQGKQQCVLQGNEGKEMAVINHSRLQKLLLKNQQLDSVQLLMQYGGAEVAMLQAVSSLLTNIGKRWSCCQVNLVTFSENKDCHLEGSKTIIFVMGSYALVMIIGEWNKSLFGISNSEFLAHLSKLATSQEMISENRKMESVGGWMLI